MPAPDYFPSWLAQFSIRFEDYGKARIEVPSKVPTRLRGTKVERDALKVVPDPDPPAGTTRLLLQGKTPSPPGPSSSQTTSSDGMTHDVGGVIPRSFSWKQNGIRHADELQLTLKWADFPFDPRVVRACAVRFFLGTVRAADYARGIGGERASSGSGQALPLNVVPEKFLDDQGRQRSNLRFTGWVDDYEVTWPDGEPLVKLTCRDQTQLFITQEAYAGWTVDPKLALDEMVAAYLAQFPAFEGISVEYRPAGTPAPKLSDSLHSLAHPPGGGPAVSKGGGGNEKMSVWDYLTDQCVSLGHIIRVDGNVVVIQRPRNLYNRDAPRRAEDPYGGRTVDGRSYPRRTFVYGRNVTDFKAVRKFARTGTAIELRCYWPDRKKTLVARSPRNAVKAAADQGSQPVDQLPIGARPGDGKSDQKWVVKVVQGIGSQEALQQMADDVYESLNRLEIQVHMKTRNLASFGGGNEDPDLLDLRAGDPVEVVADRGEDFSTVTGQEHALSVLGLGRDELVAMGYAAALADAHEKAFADAGFTTSFFTREVDITGDIEQGVSLEVVGINYVEARTDAKPSG